jgi:hypothetical protein
MLSKLQRTDEEDEYTVRTSNENQYGELNVKLYSDLSPHGDE